MKIYAFIFTVAAILCGCGTDSPWSHQTFAFDAASDPPSTNTSTNIVALNRVTVSPLFQSRSFTYRTAPDAYKQDPYAGFLIAPERAIAEAIRGRLGGIGRAADPDGVLTPNLGVEVVVTKLYGDFQDSANPAGTLQLHFLLYETTPNGPGRVVLDEICGRSTTLACKTPAALMAAWDADLHDIMDQINSDYAKANSNDSR